MDMLILNANFVE